MRGLMGSFATMPLADVVELLARRKATGSLVCERGSVRKTLYLQEGVAIGAASNDPREYLGQLLLNFGHIDEEQLANAFRTQEQTKVRLGKVLTMLGHVAPETIRQVLALKIRETLLDALIWDSGVFHVDDAPPPPAEDLDAAVPLAEIAREAELRARAWAAFRAAFPTGAATLSVDEARVAPALAPDSFDGRLLVLARDGKTVDEIGVALRATDFHLYQRLYALHGEGVVTAAAPAAMSTAAAGPSAMDLVEEARRHLAAGRYGKAEAIAARAAGLARGLAPANAILADSRRALSTQLRAELLDPPRIPLVCAAAEEIAPLRLSSAERLLLARCDGTRDLRAIAEVTPLSELDVLKAFQALAARHVVELRSPPPT